MRHNALPHLALTASLSLGACAPSAPARAPASRSLYRYSAPNGAWPQSTLAIEQAADGQRLSGVTQFDDGSCLEEAATTDRSGRLVRAEYTFTRRALPNAHVVLDARAGMVEVAGPVFPMRWSLPNDLPWVWAPALDNGGGAQAVATPLAALVTLQGTQAAGAVRAIDLSALHSDRVSSGELRSRDAEQAESVVVGDDQVAVQDGLPQHWHLGALDREVQAGASSDPPGTLAAFVCAPIGRSKS
jgi:hypothetical protein